MNLIAAVDKNWGIGYKGQLLDHISEDLKYFKEKTTGKVVIMGKNTFLSLPNQEPLPNRENLVISSSNFDNVKTFKTPEDALKYAREKYNENDIFIIGGGMLYRTMLPFCDTAYITKIDKEYIADTFLQNLDDYMDCVDTESLTTKKGLNISFNTYKKRV